MSKNKWIILAVVLFLAGVLLKIPKLTVEDFNYDSLATSYEVTYKYSYLLFDYCFGGTLVPLYFIIQKAITSVFGVSEASLRILNIVLCGLIPVAMLYINDKKSLLLATIVFFLYHFSYSTFPFTYFARPYILQSLLVIIYLEYLRKIVIDKDLTLKTSKMYVLVAFSIFMTNHSGGFLVVSLSYFFLLYLLLRREFKLLTRFYLNSNVIAVLYLPWFLAGTNKVIKLDKWWVETPSSETMKTVMVNLFSPDIIIFAFQILIVLLPFVFKNKEDNWLSKRKFYLLVVVVVFSAFYIKSFFRASIFHENYLSMLLPVWIMVIALSSMIIIRKNKAFALLPILLIIFMIEDTYKKEPYVKDISSADAFDSIIKKSKESKINFNIENSVLIPLVYNHNFYKMILDRRPFFGEHISRLRPLVRLNKELPPEELREMIDQLNKKYIWFYVNRYSNTKFMDESNYKKIYSESIDGEEGFRNIELWEKTE